MVSIDDVDDRVAQILTAGPGITITYSDLLDAITITATGEVAGITGADEVWVGPSAPGDPGIELWYDTDAAQGAGALRVRIGGSWQDVAIAGPEGPPGPPGPPGPSTNFFEYNWNDNTDVPPGNGQLRYSEVNQTDHGYLYASNLTALDQDVRVLLATIKKNDKIIVQDKDDASKYQVYYMDDDLVDQDTYWELSVTWLEGGATIPAQRCMLGVFQQADPYDLRGGKPGELLTKSDFSDYSFYWTNRYGQRIVWENDSALYTGTAENTLASYIIPAGLPGMLGGPGGFKWVFTTHMLVTNNSGGPCDLTIRCKVNETTSIGTSQMSLPTATGERACEVTWTLMADNDYNLNQKAAFKVGGVMAQPSTTDDAFNRFGYSRGNSIVQATWQSNITLAVTAQLSVGTSTQVEYHGHDVIFFQTTPG